MAKKAAQKKATSLKARVSELRVLKGAAQVQGGLKANTKLWSDGVPQTLHTSCSVGTRLKARQRGDSSARAADDSASIRFSAQTANSEIAMLIVMTRDYYYYYVRAMGPLGSSDDDGKRFVRSFRLVTPTAGDRQ